MKGGPSGNISTSISTQTRGLCWGQGYQLTINMIPNCFPQVPTHTPHLTQFSQVQVSLISQHVVQNCGAASTLCLSVSLNSRFAFLHWGCRETPVHVGVRLGRFGGKEIVKSVTHLYNIPDGILHWNSFLNHIVVEDTTSRNQTFGKCCAKGLLWRRNIPDTTTAEIFLKRQP